MLRRFFFFLFLLGCGFNIARLPAVEEELEIKVPEQFSVTQHWFSWTNAFDIIGPVGKMGTVHRRFFSMTVEYDFYDLMENLQSNARMRFFSIGAKFDVIDKTGNLIGTTEQKIFSFFPTFEIFSPQRESLGMAKMNFWGTKYTLYDSVTNEEFALMSRPFFRFRDHWKVTITNPTLFSQKNIAPQLFIIVMAFQTDMDFWRRVAYHNHHHISSLNSMSSNDTRWIELREKLDLHREVNSELKPSEADFIYVEDFVDIYLAERLPEASKESSHDQEREYQDMEAMASNFAKYREDKLYEGLNLLLSLLDQGSLTDAQKRALFLMMDAQLKQ